MYDLAHMATLTNVPGAPTVLISVMTEGQWCIHSSFPGSVLLLIEKRATDSAFAEFSATKNGSKLIRANSQAVTVIPAPDDISLSWL